MYLHELGIGHRDIKLDNIMMTNGHRGVIPKFIDFGLSKVFTPNEKSTDPFGTLAYCAPEVILQRPHDIRSDIWSMGICLHMLLSGCFPFLSTDLKQTARNIVAGKVNFNL